MAAVLAEVVLKKLGSLAADQASLLWGLKSEIPKLQSTVSTIQAVLLDAEEQSNHNHQVQPWLRELRGVLYDAEDMLDDFFTEVLRKNQMGGNLVRNGVSTFFSPSNQVVYGLKMANQIKAIRKKLDAIDQNRKQFDFQVRPVDLVIANKDWRQTHSSIPDVVIGREEDKQKIIDMLLLSSSKEKVSVIPIIGMGGLGKTTLAQQIYNDERVKSAFECKLWVCVSETFEPKLLLKNILESIITQKVEDLALNTLKDILHEKIKNKRLVLDDVWNEDTEKWGCFQNILSSGATEGSKILVTTRLRIAVEMTTTDAMVPYELDSLSQPDSWSLFKTIAFKKETTPDPRFAEIGEEIVRKCGGVPLAIRTMGGLLHFKDTVSEWEAVSKKQLFNFCGQGHEILTATLKLSYDNLPFHLKRCFVYCSVFPKDHVFDVQMLIQLWMAQGYIKSSQSLHLEDVGVEYFKNLLWRSFFQEVTDDTWGSMGSCKMHDLIHDLAVTAAGEDVLVLKASNVTDHDFGGGSINFERIRHISIDFEDKSRETWKVPPILAKATKLRTFLVHNVPRPGVHLEAGGCEKIFSNMKRLRVLSLDRVCVKIVPATIHKLKHLRYLDLSHNEMKMLPDDEILTLVNLQVLFLHWCSKLRQLPQNIGKLSNLAYLGLDGCSSLSWIPAGIRKLTYLRELSLFVVTEVGVVESGKAAGLGEFKYLNNLGWKLRIKGLERVKNKSEAKALNLKEKSHLRCLELRWSSTSSRGGRGNENDARSDHDRSILEELQPHGYIKKIDMEGYVGKSLPNSLFSSARNMVRINLSSCINLMSLPSLDPLVSLKVLVLFGLDSLEYMQSEMIPSSQSNNNDSQYLPSLERLEIWRCPNLIGWSTTKIQELPHLPLVSHLVINGCPKMASVPRFSVCFKYVGLSKISSELLREFGVSLSPPLPSAQARFDRLFLEDVRDLRVLPQELLSHLSPLQNLYLRGCDDITTIPPTILHHLPCLLELHIWGVDPFKMEDYSDNDDDGYDDYDVNRYMPLHILPSLRVLELLGVSKLVNLPEWLQHSSNLQRLEICRCQKLKCLPDWLIKLTALESMNVRKCKLLSERCGSNKAEDWPNIAHIPNITVDSTMIQKDGHYLEGEDTEEEEEEQPEEENEEASSHTQFWRSLTNCVGRLTCNLFQRCFLSS